MQGNAFHRIDGLLYGNVAVTLVVQLAFNHLMQAAFGNRRQHLVQSGLFFLVLLGFSTGGFIGAWGTRQYDERVLWIAAAILGGLGVWGFVRQDAGRTGRHSRSTTLGSHDGSVEIQRTETQ